jgi:mono/diheme cytochrome c family protein
MEGFRVSGGRAFAACAALVMALGGCAPHPASPARPARSAGGNIYDKWCSDCHGAAEGPGSVALQRKYGGSFPAILEQRTDLSPDYVKFVVRHGISFMPSFRKTEIGDADLALLAAYLAPSQAGTRPARRSGPSQGQ